MTKLTDTDSESRSARMEPPVRHGQSGMVGGIAPDAALTPDGALYELTDEFRDELLKLVRTGDTIGAIKHVRARTGLGLNEAKDVIDGLLQDGVTQKVYE